MLLSRLLALCFFAVLLSGCTPVMPLKGDDIPQEGDYTVILRETGKSTLHHVGTTAFTNARHRIPLNVGVGEKLKEDIVDRMRELSGYRFLEVDAELGPMVLPRFYGASGLYTSTEEIKTDQAAVDERLREIAAENDLRFVLLLDEWGGSDKASRTNQPLVGNGVQFRSMFGSRSVTAFSIFRLRLYDSITGKSNYWIKTFLQELPDEAWIEVSKEAPPPESAVESLRPAIESTITPGASKELLCAVGLLPPPSITRPGTPYSACRKAFGSY